MYLKTCDLTKIKKMYKNKLFITLNLNLSFFSVYKCILLLILMKNIVYFKVIDLFLYNFIINFQIFK